MKKAIDVRSMHTAIHSLFIVNSKPKTVLKAFNRLQDVSVGMEEWEIINSNCESFGEINFRNIDGGRLCRNNEPVDDCIYDDGENKFKIIGRYDLYGF